ncbi:MAG: hypothetical protein ACYC63_04670 [Armatimonadota bacterium]
MNDKTEAEYQANRAKRMAKLESELRSLRAGQTPAEHVPLRVIGSRV